MEWISAVKLGLAIGVVAGFAAGFAYGAFLSKRIIKTMRN